MADLIPGIPEESVDIFMRLVKEDVVPIEQTRREVAAYMAELENMVKANEFIDLRIARKCAEACKALLAQLSDDSPQEHRGLVQAAARYFVLDEDGDGDLTSMIGFDDDAEVINAVATHLERGDVRISLI